ncbi:hypothetical protein E4T56_gene18424 [Termitomyces sp. T112]|nr:hypothetical protein E4T56_gene18424 [Termitomyces sp. T112]
MSTSNPNRLPTFLDKLQLDGANFVHFKNRVLIAAHACRAKGYLEGTIPYLDPPASPKADEKPLGKATKFPVKPVDTGEQATTTTTPWTSCNPTEEEWDLHNAWMLGFIVYNCKNPVRLGIKMDGTAAEAWNSLTKAYGVVSNLATMGAKNALHATRTAANTMVMVAAPLKMPVDLDSWHCRFGHVGNPSVRGICEDLVLPNTSTDAPAVPPPLCQSSCLQGMPALELPKSYLAQNMYTFMALLTVTNTDNNEYMPKTYAEAMHHPDLWMLAIEQELKVMKERKVWRLVLESDVPAEKQAIGCQWVFANKYNAEGQIVGQKARLVAKRYSQVVGEDYDETYAVIWQIDFITVYLNSILEFQVFMDLPPGFPGGEGKKLELWYWTLDAAYRSLGYYTSQADPCVKSRKVDDECTTTDTFNDDIFGTSMTHKGADKAKQELTEIYNVKDLGEPSFILDMAIEKDFMTGSMLLSQKAYLRQVLKQFDMSDCNPHSTPLPAGIHLMETMAPQSEANHHFMADKLYCLLAHFQSSPGPAYWNTLVHMLGLTNSPTTFQMMMNDIFWNLIANSIVCVYLDNILIYTKMLEEHHQITHLILEHLCQHQLYLKLEKCEFEQTQIEYLSLIILHGAMEINPVKVAGVAEWPEPKNKKKDFLHYACPLFDLTGKDIVWSWGPLEQAAFNALKCTIISGPILFFPDDNSPFWVEANSSNFAMGGSPLAAIPRE